MSSEDGSARTSGGVLVVGAGPTGLTLALALRAYGVPFSVIERRNDIGVDTKALGINVLSQYLFEGIGCAGALGKSGERVDRMAIYWEGRRLNAVDFRRLRGTVRGFITQPQWTTEAELQAALEARGGAVRRGVELVDLAEEGSEVRATLAAAGRTWSERYAFVVGCDGKGSRVRAKLGIGLRGWDYPVHFALGDFELEGADLPRGIVHYFVYEDTFFIFAPVDARRWRIVVRQDGPCPHGSAPQASSITAPVQRRLGFRVVGDPSWLSRAPFYMRVADSLGAGRALLAGDAAHLFSPIGGTGMNTGMQDAFNLAWKLAYIWQQRARGDGLLQSYGAERLEAIRATARVTDLSTRLITRSERDEGTIAPYLPKMSNRRALAWDLPFVHSGLGVGYSPSAAIAPPCGTTGARTGMVLPASYELRTALGAREASRPGDLLFLGVAGAAGADECATFARAARAIQARYGFCHSVLVAPRSTLASASTDRVAAIAAEDLAAPFRFRDRTACIVRPDGVVGWVGGWNAADAALAYLDEFLMPQTMRKAVA